MAMRRDIGLVGLTFVAVGGVLGSGWLFAPLLASQLAGPAAIIAWAIGGIAMLLLALTFAETTTMFPIAGGLARIPQFSHGRMLAMVLGWSAWAGYCTTAPIEVEATLRYSAAYLPWIHDGSTGGLTTAGFIAAAALLAVLTVVNAVGVAWFTRINTTLTWVKLVVPLLFVVVILSVRFEPANFSSAGGFAPFGVGGIFAAVASGGVVFAFVGFRHAIDMAGEAKNPQVTIPLALGLSVIICFLVYGLIQLSFVGAVSEGQLANGWAQLEATSRLGPLGALATALGILWMVSLLNAAAVISPMGGALVSVGSNGRLALAMANNGVFPKTIAALNASGVPLNALVLNYVVALVMLVTMPFTEIVALNGAAIVLSFISGPIAVAALRRLAPDYPRTFRLRFATFFAAVGFMIATLMIFWSGWDTIWRLLALLGIGLALFTVRLMMVEREELDLRGAFWFAPYFLGVSVLSLLSSYSGGLGWLPDPWASLAVAALALGMFFVSLSARLSREQFDRYIAEEETFEEDEYGNGPAKNPAGA